MIGLTDLTAVQDKVVANALPELKLPNIPIQFSFQSGSVYFFGEGADLDIVVLVYDKDDYHAALVKEGWMGSDNGHSEAEFVSYRRGQINLLVTDQLAYAVRMKVARDTCKKLADIDMLDKDKAHRVAIHRAIFMEDTNQCLTQR